MQNHDPSGKFSAAGKRGRGSLGGLMVAALSGCAWHDAPVEYPSRIVGSAGVYERWDHRRHGELEVLADQVVVDQRREGEQTDQPIDHRGNPREQSDRWSQQPAERRRRELDQEDRPEEKIPTFRAVMAVDPSGDLPRLKLKRVPVAGERFVETIQFGQRRAAIGQYAGLLRLDRQRSIEISQRLPVLPLLPPFS